LRRSDRANVACRSTGPDCPAANLRPGRLPPTASAATPRRWPARTWPAISSRCGRTRPHDKHLSDDRPHGAKPGRPGL